MSAFIRMVHCPLFNRHLLLTARQYELGRNSSHVRVLSTNLQRHKMLLPAKWNTWNITQVRPNTTNITVTEEEQDEGSELQVPVRKTERISKAMKAYIRRAQEHDEFMKQQKIEFDIGKRHLANMMGEDPETFTQQDIDNAIRYLFPCGLYDRQARPIMKPPEEIFPHKKAAEFDVSGRPFNFLFYTAYANFYQILHNAVKKLKELEQYEESLPRTGDIQPEKMSRSGSEWISKEHLENMVVEKMKDKHYELFISTLERLAEHPYSKRVEPFLMQYRRTLIARSKILDVPKPLYDDNGRAYLKIMTQRKTALAYTTVWYPGNGKLTINGFDLQYFPDVQSREQIFFPLQFTGMAGKVDIEATVTGSAETGQSGAIRFGISKCLQAFVDKDTIERMRLAGLLQSDFRIRERKKVGQPKARKKPTWKKR